MKKPAHLTPGEFELMEILWKIGEASVREVWERVDAQRPLAYTTVMTVLDKLRRKKMVRQRQEGKAYFYTPRIDRQAALQEVVDHVVQTYFQGSAQHLQRFLDDQSNNGRTHQPSLPRKESPRLESPVETEHRKEDTLEEFLL